MDNSYSTYQVLDVNQDLPQLFSGEFVNGYYVIIGLAEIFYRGKTHNHNEGLIVMLIKPDMSIVIHDDKGVKGLNYLINASMVNFSYDNNVLTINAEKQDEMLEVIFGKIDALYVIDYMQRKQDTKIIKPHKESVNKSSSVNDNIKSNDLDELRKIYPRAYFLWDEEEDNKLITEFKSGKSIKDLSNEFQRQQSAIRSRLNKYGLLLNYK